MLASVQLQGSDLLQRIIDVAAARAQSVLGDGLTLHRCDDVTIRRGCTEPVFEAWCVRSDARVATITAFATSHDIGGRQHVVAAGRFTFSAISTGQHE